MQAQTDSSYRGKTKYDDRTAMAYKDRPPRQQAAEMALIDRVFQHLPQDLRVLDLPCGGGRVSVHLARKGYQISGADNSEAMVGISRRFLAESGLNCPVSRQDIEALSYAGGEFDAIICFRLFHHFPNPRLRQQAVSELCRVAGRYVAISYFSPLSVTSLKRRLRSAIGGRGSEKYATPLGEVETYFRKQGFRLVKDFARSPFLHTLHVALFARVDEVL